MPAPVPTKAAPLKRSAQARWQRFMSPFVAPDVFDFWAGLINPTWSWAQPLARVVARREEARDTVTLVLRPNRHCAQVRPGQHVLVGAEVRGRLVTRSYSPSRVDAAAGLLEITVKRVGGGLLSTRLCQHTPVGEVLHLGAAFGEMAWHEDGQGAYLFLAAGSGITPFMALIREHAARGQNQAAQLIYWARNQTDLCFVTELREHCARVPLLHCTFVLTEEAAATAETPSGMITAEQLRRLAPDLHRRHVRICGPAGFVAAAQALTQGQAQSVLAEGFTPAPPADLDSLVGMVQVTLQRSGRVLTVPRQTSLLAALEAQGLQPAAGCRMGVCRTCVCPRVRGQTQDLLTGERQTESGQSLRLCVSRACTDLTLDL